MARRPVVADRSRQPTPPPPNGVDASAHPAAPRELGSRRLTRCGVGRRLRPPRGRAGGAGGLLLVARPGGRPGAGPLSPAGPEPQTRQIIEQLADSLRAVGLPADPLYAK